MDTGVSLGAGLERRCNEVALDAGRLSAMFTKSARRVLEGPLSDEAASRIRTRIEKEKGDYTVEEAALVAEADHYGGLPMEPDGTYPYMR